MSYIQYEVSVGNPGNITTKRTANILVYEPTGVNFDDYEIEVKGWTQLSISDYTDNNKVDAAMLGSNATLTVLVDSKDSLWYTQVPMGCKVAIQIYEGSSGIYQWVGYISGISESNPFSSQVEPVTINLVSILSSTNSKYYKFEDLATLPETPWDAILEYFDSLNMAVFISKVQDIYEYEKFITWRAYINEIGESVTLWDIIKDFCMYFNLYCTVETSGVWFKQRNLIGTENQVVQYNKYTPTSVDTSNRWTKTIHYQNIDSNNIVADNLSVGYSTPYTLISLSSDLKKWEQDSDEIDYDDHLEAYIYNPWMRIVNQPSNKDISHVPSTHRNANQVCYQLSSSADGGNPTWDARDISDILISGYEGPSGGATANCYFGRTLSQIPDDFAMVTNNWGTNYYYENESSQLGFAENTSYPPDLWIGDPTYAPEDSTEITYDTDLSFTLDGILQERDLTNRLNKITDDGGCYPRSWTNDSIGDDTNLNTASWGIFKMDENDPEREFFKKSNNCSDGILSSNHYRIDNTVGPAYYTRGIFSGVRELKYWDDQSGQWVEKTAWINPLWGNVMQAPAGGSELESQFKNAFITAKQYSENVGIVKTILADGEYISLGRDYNNKNYPNIIALDATLRYHSAVQPVGYDPYLTAYSFVDSNLNTWTRYSEPELQYGSWFQCRSKDAYRHGSEFSRTLGGELYPAKCNYEVHCDIHFKNGIQMSLATSYNLYSGFTGEMTYDTDLTLKSDYQRAYSNWIPSNLSKPVGTTATISVNYLGTNYDVSLDDATIYLGQNYYIGQNSSKHNANLNGLSSANWLGLPDLSNIYFNVYFTLNDTRVMGLWYPSLDTDFYGVTNIRVQITPTVRTFWSAYQTPYDATYEKNFIRMITLDHSEELKGSFNDLFETSDNYENVSYTWTNTKESFKKNELSISQGLCSNNSELWIRPINAVSNYINRVDSYGNILEKGTSEQVNFEFLTNQYKESVKTVNITLKTIPYNIDDYRFTLSGIGWNRLKAVGYQYDVLEGQTEYEFEELKEIDTTEDLPVII